MVPQRVVLLACGSYNPITNMHLRMFELAKDSLQKTGRYKVVGGIISPVNDKYDKKDLASASHRCAMLRLALKSSDWIRLNTWEVEQTEWSQTAKVLRHVESVVQTNCNNTTVATESPKNNTKKKRKVQRSPKKDSTDFTITSISEHEGPPQLKLLCGADLLESFAVPNLWKDEDIEDIVANYGLVCITRNGSNPQRFIYESDMLSRYENNIHIVTEWITNDISSTKIRRSLRRSESIKYLVQDPVIDYIHKHKLYQPVDNKLINHMVLSPEKDVPNVGYVSPPGCLPVPKHTEYNRSPSSGYGSGYDSSPTMHPLDVYDAQQEACKDAVKDESDYENIDSGMETSNMAENDLELITVPVPSLTKKHMATNTSPARFKSLWGYEKGTVFDFEGYGREYAVPPESPKLLHDAMNWLESGRSPSKFKLVPGSPRKKDAVDGCHLHGLTGVSSLNSSFSKSSHSLRNLVGTSDYSLMSNSRPTHPGAGTNEIPVQQSDTLPNSKTNPLLNQSFHQRSNSDINASAIQTRSDILSNLQTRKCSNCNRPASTYDEVLRLSFTNLNQTSSHSSSLNDHMLIDIDDKPQPFPVDPKSTPNTAETKTSLTSNESNCSEESSPRGSLPSSRNSGSSGSNNKGSINEIRTPNKPASRTFSDILKGVRNLRFGPCLPSETCV